MKQTCKFWRVYGRFQDTLYLRSVIELQIHSILLFVESPKLK